MKALCEKTRQLTAAPKPDFVPQRTVTVAEALLLEWAAPSTGLALRVLQQCIAGMAGTQEDLDRVRKRLAKIKKGLQKVAGMPKKAVLAGERGAAPRVALLPGVRNFIPPDPHGGATGQSQRRSRQGRGHSPW